jgi:methylenetetrahydrofolate dehydrogenase (NADP+)/methenyltetrahydrofolate cyclohydrolase
MTTQLIDGKAFAEKLRADIAVRVAKLKAERGITPGLAVIRVGDDPASEIYVRNKVKQTREVGMSGHDTFLPSTTTQEALLRIIDGLNRNLSVHGILVQLPLPKHIDENAIINAISPDKDVDGFHVISAGKLATGQDGFVPCTPLGCLMLLKDRLGDMSGLHAVIIGRSNIVGKPMAALLLKESCTVTIAHSKTRDLHALVKTADIVVAAVGRPEMVRGSWIKQGATIIDVGINRITGADGKTRLVGDVATAECMGIASAITPVPGGVGPMTIACLLENTCRSANRL